MGKIHDFLWQSSTPECNIFDSFIISRNTLRNYRFLACAAMIFIYFWTVRGLFTSFKFLTRWGEFFVGMYFILACLCYFIYKDERDTERSGPYALWKWAHIFGEIAFTLQVLIPIFYWKFVFGTETLPEAYETWIWKTIAAHGVTAGFIWLDVFFNRVKFYVNHAVPLLMFGTFYMIINFTVTKVTGTPVYQPLDFQSLKTLVLLCGAMILTVIGFVLGLVITRVKAKAAGDKDKSEDLYRSSTSTTLESV